MPAMTELRTPPATQANVIALYSQGTSQRQIARDLGIDKNTVAAILKAFSQDQSKSVSEIEQITPLAYTAVKQAVTRGDAKIGMDWLKCTVFSQPTGDRYTINADKVLVGGLDMMPLKSSTMPAQLPTGTEAGANPTPNDIGLSSHTNFSQFSTPDLIAELARRGVEVK